MKKSWGWGFRILLILSVSLVLVLVLVGRHFKDLASQYHAGDYMLDLLWRPPPAQPQIKQTPGVQEDKVIVMGTLEEEEVGWVKSELPDWKRAIYIVNPSQRSVNDPNVLTTPANKGNEAMAYLTYIIDHYDSLSSTMAFLHSHRGGFLKAWHVDAALHDNALAMRSLKLDFVQQNGYVNLRCNLNPGCIDPYYSTNGHVTDEIWQEIFGNRNISTPIMKTAASVPQHTSSRHHARMYGGGSKKKLTAPTHLGVACCAQFAVSKDQVLKRPVEDYIAFRQWIMENERNNSGRVFEYLWHIIFGKHPLYCPEESQCYCQVYGQC